MGHWNLSLMIQIKALLKYFNLGFLGFKLNMAGQASKENGKKGGRPKGAISAATRDAIEGKKRMVELINAKVEDLITWLFEKAKQVDEKGNPVIDVTAIKELLDRGYGKAAQSVDVTSKGEQIVSASPEALALAKEYEEKIKKGL